MKKRIVVTGVGIVSPLGIGINENWERYLSGISGIGELSKEGMDKMLCAGQVSDEELGNFILNDKKNKVDRFTSFALVAAGQALADAKVDNDDRQKTGVFVGSAYSGLDIIENQIRTLYTESPRRVHPLLMQKNLTNAPSGEIAIELDLKGPNIGFSSGACSSDHSIIQAYNMLQQNDINVMVAGGTEAPLLSTVFGELSHKGMFNGNGGSSDPVSCPFDVRRNGFVLSEGAGIIVMETLSSAEKRGADIYGEIAGFGTSYVNDVYSDKSKRGFSSRVLCIKQALESASVDPSGVDYVNASGISGITEDMEESQVMKTVFGRQTGHIPISSTKGSMGLTIGASGVIDLIFSLLALKKQILPQTHRLEDVDPVCNSLSHLKEPVASLATTILSNNFGYAGNNVSLVIKCI
ncbi:MAG: beta-ketoacyl-[acyl-carrier-protein] synthase family protein [Planctomycetes bacterium]|nr:beta-ketoacyl-[acyl-carrier-protein] synthase family protein [Planctomycetota bacterium]